MPYGQIHYQQKLGNSNLTLAEAGCFVTAFCNLFEKIGSPVDPATLDKFFQDHGVFLYDLADHANDDLSWWSGTKYDPHVTVAKTGNGGFPDSDLAIVEFRYKSHTGATITHFCAVHSAADRTIIDSWDGLVKGPAQYENYYGNPVAWATYNNNVPQVEGPAPSAPASAPAAQAQAPAAPAPASPRQIHLPAWVWIWHVYKPGGPYTLPYAIGALDPKMFGGLTYDIQGNPAPNIYLIQTQDFGLAAIYAGPDTAAQFTDGGHGEGESTPEVEVVPAPTPTAEPTTPSVTYTRFDEPMKLVTKDGAEKVDFLTGNTMDTPAAGTPFTAVGKATLANGDVYYMNDNDFGIADEKGSTPLPRGIKTIFLAPAPQEDAPPKVNVVKSPATVEFKINDSTAAPEEPEASATSDKQPVWKATFETIVKGDDKQNPTSIDYAANDAMEVYNFDTGDDVVSVPQNQPVPVVGTFIFAGHRYYLSKSSFIKGTSYGFPVSSLHRQKASNTPFNTGDDINQLGDEALALSKPKHATIKAGATAQGLLSRFRKH